MKKGRTLVYDIETFANLFTFVGRYIDSSDYVQFVIWDTDRTNEAFAFNMFLEETRPNMIGYNNLGFDGQVIEYMYRNNIYDAKEIYRFVNEELKGKGVFDAPYKPWDFTFPQLDLMAINNFGVTGTPTSLKWLEFSMRMSELEDLPFSHEDIIEDRKLVDKVVKYNYKDVDNTYVFYEDNIRAIDMRSRLVAKYNDKMIYNQPDSSIGAKIILYSYCEATKKDIKKVKRLTTNRKKIDVKDIILPYFNFKNPIFKEVKKDFENLTLKANSKGVINLKGVYEKKIEFQNMEVSYGLGGIHGAANPGIYKSDDKHIIKSYDVTSMYPNLAIANKFYPKSLGIEFCKVYKEEILDERKKYPKIQDPEMNKTYKLAANCVYGKSNASRDNFLKDPQYTLQTTINGQLALTLLGEWLSEIGEFIMWNTDGSEIIIPRDKEQEYMYICDKWCDLTGINLEHDNYDTLFLRDVNNYIGLYDTGKVKRKGYFCIYEDYKGSWDKNPSGLIIPLAINNYFIHGAPVEETIRSHNNIHDFLYGIKGGKDYEYWLLDISEDSVHSIDRLNCRAYRYYISTDGKNILKNWIGGKKLGDLPSAVPNTKGIKIKGCQNVKVKDGSIFREKRYRLTPTEYSEPDTNGKRKVIKKAVFDTKIESVYPDIDYDYYINKALEEINKIEYYDN